MYINSKINIFCICILLNVLTSPANAVPITTNFSGAIDWISAVNGSDTYGIGISSISIGDTFNLSITYDSDSAMFYSGPSDGFGDDYNFYGSPYGGSFSINGNNYSSQWSSLNVGNDVVLPPPPGFTVDQPLIDLGIPSDLSGFVIDQLWMGLLSEDYMWNGDNINGLELSVVFLDLGGTIFNDTLIPGSVPSLETIDFAFFQIQQYSNGVPVFEAIGMLANNYSPVPIPSAVWLFGSGLLGFIGIARRRTHN